MMKAWIKNEQGFSIVEMVVVIAIMGILGSTLMGLTSTSSQLYRNSNEEMQASEEARISLEWITAECRRNDRSRGIEFHESGGVQALKFNRTGGLQPLWIYYDSTESDLYYTEWNSIAGGNGNVPTAFTTGDYITNVAFNNVLHNDIGGIDYVSAFDLTITYTTGNGNSETLTTYIEIRSDHE